MTYREATNTTTSEKGQHYNPYHLDWSGGIEEICFRTIAAERSA